MWAVRAISLRNGWCCKVPYKAASMTGSHVAPGSEVLAPCSLSLSLSLSLPSPLSLFLFSLSLYLFLSLSSLSFFLFEQNLHFASSLLGGFLASYQ